MIHMHATHAFGNGHVLEGRWSILIVEGIVGETERQDRQRDGGGTEQTCVVAILIKSSSRGFIFCFVHPTPAARVRCMRRCPKLCFLKCPHDDAEVLDLSPGGNCYDRGSDGDSRGPGLGMRCL